MLEDLKDDSDQQGIQIVDFSQIIISTVMAAMHEGEELNLTLMRHLALNSIRFNISRYKQKYPEIVIAFDDSSGGYWRRKRIGDYYKRNRNKQRDATNWDWETIYAGIDALRTEIADYMPYKVVSIPTYEADDIIAVLTKYYAGKKPIMIISADGDFTQLHTYPNVKQWSPIQEKFVHPKTGCGRKDILTKIIKGDAKDGIANIKSVSDFHVSKEDGARQSPITKKILEPALESDDPKSLFENEELERFEENELMLDFNKIPMDIQEHILEVYKEAKPAPRRKLFSYFAKNRLTKLMDSLADF